MKSNDTLEPKNEKYKYYEPYPKKQSYSDRDIEPSMAIPT